ncbi:SWI/SNF complex subunit SWI3B, partial [Cucurbita argyrosperma subsp. argyrosperma]
MGLSYLFCSDSGNDVVSCGGSTARSSFSVSSVDANSQIEKEEVAVEKAISHILDVQMKEAVDKLDRLEEIDLQMEKEFKQLDQMKSMLFVDQLNLLFRKGCIPTIEDKNSKNLSTY